MKIYTYKRDTYVLSSNTQTNDLFSRAEDHALWTGHRVQATSPSARQWSGPKQILLIRY